MANYRNHTGVPAVYEGRENPWAGEITPPVRENMARTPGPADMTEISMSGGTLDMSNGLPSEVVESPTTLNEAYLGSLKSLLNRNKGSYIVATFLIGPQNEAVWDGILYDVGNDYVTIHQMGRGRFIVCDIYSLKYLEFYSTGGRGPSQRPQGTSAQQPREQGR